MNNRKGKSGIGLQAVAMFLLATSATAGSAMAVDKVGVIDRAGKFVIPANYEGIFYLDNGIFKCYPIHAGRNWRLRTDKEIIENEKTGYEELEGVEYRDRNNRLVDEPVTFAPNLCVVQTPHPWTDKIMVNANETSNSQVFYRNKQLFEIPRIYTDVEKLQDNRFLVSTPNGDVSKMPPPMVVNETGQIINKLPAQVRVIKVGKSTIVFLSSSDFSTEKKEGKELGFADFDGHISKTIRISGFMTSWDSARDIAVLELKDEEVAEISNGRAKHGIISDQGDWIIQPDFVNLQVCESDRFIETIYKKHFDIRECKSDPTSLGEQFGLLLRDYDLIGMPRSQLIDLIGPGDPNFRISNVKSYVIGGYGSECGNAYVNLEIRYDDKMEKVTGWRIPAGYNFPNRPNQPWIETNVVFSGDGAKTKFKHSTLPTILLGSVVLAALILVVLDASDLKKGTDV